MPLDSLSVEVFRLPFERPESDGPDHLAQGAVMGRAAIGIGLFVAAPFVLGRTRGGR